jgi:hypothetical protein
VTSGSYSDTSPSLISTPYLDKENRSPSENQPKPLCLARVPAFSWYDRQPEYRLRVSQFIWYFFRTTLFFVNFFIMVVGLHSISPKKSGTRQVPKCDLWMVFNYIIIILTLWHIRTSIPGPAELTMTCRCIGYTPMKCCCMQEHLPFLWTSPLANAHSRSVADCWERPASCTLNANHDFLGTRIQSWTSLWSSTTSKHLRKFKGDLSGFNYSCPCGCRKKVKIAGLH